MEVRVSKATASKVGFPLVLGRWRAKQNDTICFLGLNCCFSKCAEFTAL